jgi:tRNA(Ile)-lysidine synthase
MLKDFLEFINTNQLCKATDKVLVAASGGKDSMALLNLFVEGQFNISVAHFNFGLRGLDSDGDENFLKEFCEKKRIPFYATKADTKKIAKEWGLSTQMAARQLRYTWFNELIVSEDFDWLATAHNLDDKIETLYLNLTKGTGPRGLKSIPLKKDKIIRPLMFAEVSEILSYLAEKNISWREDASNQTVDYQRNKIRHQVIPILKEINPGLTNTAQINFSRINDLNAIFDEKLERFKQSIDFGEIIKIPFSEWQNTPGFTLMIEEFLKPYGFNYQEVTDLLNATISGKKIKSNTHEIVTGRNDWFLEKKSEYNEETNFQFKESGIYEIGKQSILLKVTTDFPSIMDIRKSEHAFFDFDTIKWPLTLRNWKHGDRFQPFGMKGKKMVSDFLIDSKIDSPQKNIQKVLCDSQDILWLVGLRTDDRFKLHSATTKILKVSFL